MNATATTRRTRADGERSRRAILDAAARLATVEGLNGLSIGVLADHIGIIAVFKVCAWLPALGLLTFLLPRAAPRL